MLTLASTNATALESSVRRVASAAVATIDLRRHAGVHPRLGTVDVVPFVPLDEASSPTAVSDLGGALAARDRFAGWAAEELGLPCFLYGPERSLPDVRRNAFGTLRPDSGPPDPHPRAGACAVGARHALVAYNLWLAGADLALARCVAAAIRGPTVRALWLDVGGRLQVSCNLTAPQITGPGAVHDAVAAMARQHGASVDAAELVGLLPAAVLAAEPPERWAELDLDPERTVERRLAGRS